MFRPRALVLSLVFLFGMGGLFFAATAQADPSQKLPGLIAEAKVVRDTHGIPHIFAGNEHDLFFLQGYVHAQDRMFQMDLTRRQASGTLAELVGPSALPGDVELRTIGLRRAAERSLAALSPRAKAALRAYADGVNAFLASNPPPVEYGLLELSHVEPWSALDSVVIGKAIAFSLSFDLDIEATVNLFTYQAVGRALGFDGTVAFFEDVFRSAPFDPASSVPDASVTTLAESRAELHARAEMRENSEQDAGWLRPESLELGRKYLERVRELPLFHEALEPRPALRDRGGSNEWAVSGRASASGRPMVANDPHLSLNMPSTFYQIHLKAGTFDVTGSGFAGLPTVILGHNRWIAWGATTNPMDVTDTFQEQVVPDSHSPSGLSIVHQGALEPILPIPQSYRVNQVGDGIFDNVVPVPPNPSIPPVTLIVPRRNHGPIISLDIAKGMALSVQYTGFGPTRELDTFLVWGGAWNLAEFIRGLQLFDFGSQNWAYADVWGIAAYFTSGELPLREDLEAGTVNGLPPFFIRNGTGGNEWLPLQHRQFGQATPNEVLPFGEMPHIINPPAGFVVNANNDPIGNTLDNNPLNEHRPTGGIFYLNVGYDFGSRAGRITQRLKELLASGDGRISFDEMQEVQADTAMLDAEYFVPVILTAFSHAEAAGAPPQLAAFAADPRIREAVGRLRHWDFTTPTGIPEGYDAADSNGTLFPPTTEEMARSVAATIYSMWRSRVLANTIDATLGPRGLPGPDSERALTALRNLLDNFATRGGRGASGLNFFNVPGIADPGPRRDILVLKSLADGLDRLASADFAAAFGRSTNQNDYRWGKLHRIVFDHPLDGPFNVPPAGGAFPQPLPNLPGVPVDGGFGVVDASNHDARANSVNGFMFGGGPVQRLVAEMAHGRVKSVNALPGGESGQLGSPFYFNLLPGWLTNDAYPVFFRMDDIVHNTSSVEKFDPDD